MTDKTYDGAGGDTRRLQQTAPGEYAPEVYTVDGRVAAVALGRMYLASSGRLTLGVAGNVRATLENPAGSGRIVRIARLAVFSTVLGWGSIRINPTGGLPASAAIPETNAILGGGDAAVAVLKADTSTTTPLSGGIDTGLETGFAAGRRTEIDLPPLILAPGVTFGVAVPFTGSSDIALAVYWTEE